MLSKYNNVLLSVVLTGIVGTVAFNVIYRYWLYNMACAGSAEAFENVCSTTTALKRIKINRGEDPNWTPEEKHDCWCARNV